jgi:hypothetical protein
MDMINKQFSRFEEAEMTRRWVEHRIDTFWSVEKQDIYKQLRELDNKCFEVTAALKVPGLIGEYEVYDTFPQFATGTYDDIKNRYRAMELKIHELDERTT